MISCGDIRREICGGITLYYNVKKEIVSFENDHFGSIIIEERLTHAYVSGSPD